MSQMEKSELPAVHTPPRKQMTFCMWSLRLRKDIRILTQMQISMKKLVQHAWNLPML